MSGHVFFFLLQPFFVHLFLTQPLVNPALTACLPSTADGYRHLAAPAIPLSPTPMNISGGADPPKVSYSLPLMHDSASPWSMFLMPSLPSASGEAESG